MAISEAAEQRMVAARAARNKQDKKHPFVINIHDGRLLPNVPNLRAHSNYRVYTGDPKASAQERLRFLSVAGHRPRVVDSEVSGEQPPTPAVRHRQGRTRRTGRVRGQPVRCHAGPWRSPERPARAGAGPGA